MEPTTDRATAIDQTDADLVGAARRGDRRAFAVLIQRHRSLLLALCRRTLGDPWLAEDASQEAVLQAMLSLGSLRHPESFSAWLCGIGLNACRRLLRSARSSAFVSWEVLVGGWSGPTREAADPGPGPAEVVEAEELGERVRTAVDSVPAGQRSAVLLFYLAGLTHREVAEALGVEVGTVKTRLHKARRSLQRRLAPLRSELEDARQTSVSGMVSEVDMSDDASELVPVRVADVRRVPEQGEAPTMHVVLLEEIGGQRSLSIWIGEWEAISLAMQLTGQQPPRPMTYVLLAALLGEVGASVRQVAITQLAQTVFYASIEVAGPNSRVASVDARPSDSLNVALATGAPILVSVGVFDAAAHPSPPSPYPDRDPFGPDTKGASEILAEAMAGWPKLPSP